MNGFQPHRDHDTSRLELEPISPELCLVDPELARAARERLPDPAPVPRPPKPIRATRAPAAPPPAARPPAKPLPAPPHRRARRHARTLPRAVVAAVLFAALVPLVPSASVRKAAVLARAERQTDTPLKAGTPEASALVVPDVCRQAYVFAKGMLQDAGFAWRVEGDIEGFAANRVARQEPSPGTLVVDTGAPTVLLALTRNPSYRQRGKPDNEAPYAGTESRVWQPLDSRFATAFRRSNPDAPILNACERGAG